MKLEIAQNISILKNNSFKTCLDSLWRPILFSNQVYLRWRRNFKYVKSHGNLENVTL